MSEVEDRRARAREACHDAIRANPDSMFAIEHGIDVAVKAATQVKITYEVLWAAGVHGATFAALKAAFETAGFEVVE